MIARLTTWLAQRQRFRSALAYNREFTFSCYTAAPHSWQCPQCGRVHRATATSKFFGPLFAACCDLPEGPRNARRFAIPHGLC